MSPREQERLRQAEAWLREHFPVKGEVRVRYNWPDAKDHGACEEDGDGGYIISIHEGSPFKIDTLLHEWAHLGKRQMNHGKLWGRRYQLIVQRWFDQGGAEASRNF